MVKAKSRQSTAGIQRNIPLSANAKANATNTGMAAPDSVFGREASNQARTLLRRMEV